MCKGRRAISALGLLVLGIIAALVGSPNEGSGLSTRISAVAKPRVATLVTIPRHVDGFAQSARYLAWVSATPGAAESCYAVTFRSLATGREVTTRRRPGACVGSGGSDLVLAEDSAYWTARFGSNLGEWSELLTVSVRERRVRDVDTQGIERAGLDLRVPPASDGRSAYFWRADYEEDAPSVVVRYEGRRARSLVRADSVRAIAAGSGRVAYADAQWTFDCATETAWSPDGRRLAYASYGGSRCAGGVWVMNANGTHRSKIDSGRSPDWSPDGQELTYRSGAGAVVVAAADGSGARTIAPRGDDPAWSPDGKTLAFERDGSIYAVGVGGGEHLVAFAGRQPDWSPDGSRLVFLSTAAPGGLATVGADGSGARSLGHAHAEQPSWSPDGRWIAFSECVDPCPGPTSISRIAPDGSGWRRVTSGGDESEDAAPSWAPDSRRLALARSHWWRDWGDSHVWTLAPDRRLTRTPPPRTPIVLTTRTGRLAGRLDPQGRVTRLALTAALEAAVVWDGRRWRIEILAPAHHLVALRRAPTAFSASGRTLVLNAGTAIYALDARRGGLRLVARAAAQPLGLSIVGKRIAWAENRGRTARVRALRLP